MNVIIIAAGRGSRLEGYTDDRPKCMVTVDGTSILEHQLRALRAQGITEIDIVRGYLADQLVVPGARYHANTNWQDNNILHSLFCAEEAMEGGFLSTYSDIVYTADVVAAALHQPGDITLVVDRQWRDAYQNRKDHPVGQAELVEVDGDLVKAVGKHIGPDQAVGEFIGLAAHSAKGAQKMREVFGDLRRSLGDDDIFRQGRIFRRAYLADLYEEMIDRGVDVHWVPIDGGWREIDTVEDLHAVNDTWTSTTDAPL